MFLHTFSNSQSLITLPLRLRAPLVVTLQLRSIAPHDTIHAMAASNAASFLGEDISLRLSRLSYNPMDEIRKGLDSDSTTKFYSVKSDGSPFASQCVQQSDASFAVDAVAEGHRRNRHSHLVSSTHESMSSAVAISHKDRECTHLLSIIRKLEKDAIEREIVNKKLEETVALLKEEVATEKLENARLKEQIMRRRPCHNCGVAGIAGAELMLMCPNCRFKGSEVMHVEFWNCQNNVSSNYIKETDRSRHQLSNLSGVTSTHPPLRVLELMLRWALAKEINPSQLPVRTLTERMCVDLYSQLLSMLMSLDKRQRLRLERLQNFSPSSHLHLIAFNSSRSKRILSNEWELLMLEHVIRLDLNKFLSVQKEAILTRRLHNARLLLELEAERRLAMRAEERSSRFLLQAQEYCYQAETVEKNSSKFRKIKEYYSNQLDTLKMDMEEFIFHEELIVGSYFLKRSRKHGPILRRVWISKDNSYLKWMNVPGPYSDAIAKGIPIGSIKDIYRGWVGVNDVYERYFTIVLTDGPMELESYSREERDFWLKRFTTFYVRHCLPLKTAVSNPEKV